MNSAPPRIAELVETFDRNIEAYHSQQYKEAQLRREFIDPFFEELGWDMTNKAGRAPQYREVIHEDAISVSGETKAPDYCFCIGSDRKFFLEAKKPSIDIKDAPHPAYQLRRYAWSVKLPLSILTDFEEFAVYDCQTRPKHTDSAATARIIFFNYKQYPEKWHEIADIFGKDAIWKGSFDKFAISEKGKRGTTTVDTEFLAEIESWRRTLAQIIALRNTTLSKYEINFAVQQTIDRILFLRMCEDRGIEPYSQLRSITPGDRVYPRLCEIFEKADQKYNSGLFHFEDEPNREPPDKLTLNLIIDDKDLKWILRSLYYPQCPYVFSFLPPEILGNVYEQFLGKVISVSSARRVKIEEKPEVKKAGGVYYTPSYIVNYIVKNTVGRLLEGSSLVDPLCHSRESGNPQPRHSERSEESQFYNSKSKIVNRKSLTPKQVANLRILDPACGSGSFLLGAYTYLLNYCRDWYAANDPAKFTKQIYQGRAGDWFLTIAEKKRILLNNIFGVDIDSQAVEVTKLSLLLKVLEGENSQTLENQYRLFHERALPDLANNIKCGNSLIGSDFYDTLDPDSITDELRRKINAFDWKTEFPQVFKQSRNRKGAVTSPADGFNAIIGNPPWGADFIQMEKTYLSQIYPEVADFESSQYFLVSGANLLKPSGTLGMIIPNTFALNVFARRCREKILSLGSISQMVDLSYVDVFSGPNVRSMILILSRTQLNQCSVYESIGFQYQFNPIRIITRKQLQTSETWKPFLTYVTPLSELFDRIISRSSPLIEYCQVRQGYIPYRTSTLTRRFGRIKAEQIVKNRLWHSLKSETPEYQRELQGKDVERYEVRWSGVWVRYGRWLSTYLPLSVFSGPRIIIREITCSLPYSLLATYVEETFVHNPSVLAVLPQPESLSPKFLLGILNSRLMSQIFFYVAPKSKKGLFPKIIITDAKRLPFPCISLSKQADKTMHDKMVKLVDRMLDLHKKLAKAKVPDEKTKLQRQISTTDHQIDNLVYQLYNLTPDEIAIVEGSDK